MKHLRRRCISLFLVALMVLCSSQALTSVYAYAQTEATENHYLGFASDLHATTGTLEGAFGNFPNDPEYVSLVGDMVGAKGGDAPAFNSGDILNRIMAIDTCKNIDSSNASIVWADHDAGVADDAGIVKGMGDPAGYTSGQIYEGKNSDGSTAYYIYVVGFYHMLKGGDISKAAADEFKSWVADKDVTIPVIVLCHAPLVAKRGDNYGATYWNEALNYAATGIEGITSDEDTGKSLIRNVIFLSGHNHTVDQNEYYYSVGSVMSVQVDSGSGLLSASGDTTVTEAYDEEIADLEASSTNTSSPTDADTASKSVALQSADLNENSADGANDSDSENSDTDSEGNDSDASNDNDADKDSDLADDDSDDAGSLTAPGGSGTKPGPNVRATGKNSVVYYTALTPGYLKTSGSATLITISDKTITLDKYNGDGETALGVTASGDSVASPQSIDRIEWDDPVYTWSDDLSTVTATRALKSNPDYTESETVSTTKTVSKQPTSTEKGEHTYTATFSNPAFETQTKVVADIDTVSEDEDTSDADSNSDSDSSSPKTGDSTEIILWTTLLALAAAEIAIIGLKKRKD